MDIVENQEKLEEYRERARQLVAQMTLEEKVEQTVNQAPAVERLGIRAYNWWNEALHGVAKGNSKQTFHPKAVGNAGCRAHVQCDSIIMDKAEVSSIPEINARHLDAAIIHEAAIGRINDEQLVKLRTMGMTEEEAEGIIIDNFLN